MKNAKPAIITDFEKILDFKFTHNNINLFNYPAEKILHGFRKDVKYKSADYLDDNGKIIALLISEFTSKDIEKLNIKNLKYLKHLVIENCGIRNIDFIKNMPELEVLNLSKNEIEDIESLSTCKDLNYLKLNNNKISDLSPIKKLHKLEELVLSDNQISKISPITELSLLKILELSYNKLENDEIINFVNKYKNTAKPYFSCPLQNNNNEGISYYQIDNSQIKQRKEITIWDEKISEIQSLLSDKTF